MLLLRIMRCPLLVVLLLAGLLVNLAAAHGDDGLLTEPLTTSLPGPAGGTPCPAGSSCPCCDNTPGCSCLKAAPSVTRRLGTRPRLWLAAGGNGITLPLPLAPRCRLSSTGLALATAPHNIVRTTVIQV